MFQPYLLFIALRYARARRRHRFATFVALVSVLGMALGVAALVIVLSVMNGFEREVTRHVLGMSAHAMMVPSAGLLNDWQPLLGTARQQPGVGAVAPYVRGGGMLSRKAEVRGVVVEGIDPAQEIEVTALGEYLDARTLASLGGDRHEVLIGRNLASELKVGVGDSMTLMVPDWNADGSARPPRYQRLQIGGVFHVGMNQYDAKLVLMRIDDAQKLFRIGDAISGIRVRFADPANAPLGVRELARALGADLQVIDWTQYHRNFFLALESQKRIMFVILVLIIAVAAFNVAANMVMIVTEKIHDIAILRTLGVTRPRIVLLFLTQGLLLGLLGAVIGAALGAWGAHESEAFARFVEATLGVDLINADVYFIDYLPADLHAADVARVTAASIVLAVIATIYPAIRAASVNPAQAVHRD